MNNQLHIYNGILCILHICLAIGFAIYFYYINHKYKNDPIKGIELSIRSHTSTISSDMTQKWESTKNVDVSIQTVQGLLISFFVITGIFHGIYFFTDKGLYKNMIRSQNNFMRWIEYSITSTMMLYIIALLSGVKDINVYILIGATNIAMVAQGQMVEKAVAENKSWYLPMIIGFLLLIVEFSVIINDFEERIREVENSQRNLPNKPKIPSWIKYMIIILFLFYSVFGFVSIYGAYSNHKYETTEKIYLLLSLISKATLGSFIAYGTSQRQKTMT